MLEQRVLDERARALRTHDLPAFLRHLDRRDRGLVRRQTRYFRNLAQLPLRTLRYDVTAAEWTGQRLPRRWERVIGVPQVTLSLQLAGYDAVPVRSTVGFVFSLRGGRVTIVSDRSASGAPLLLGPPAPWDLEAVTVRTARGVLGVFDAGTVASAPEVVSAVRAGIDRLDRALPFGWPGRVVIYTVGDPAFLHSLTRVPGGSIEHLGGLAFPVHAEPGSTRVAATRMLLMPGSVRAGQPFLGRLTRHELGHVALGARDDGTPTWVAEGIAEYLGARDLTRAQRTIPTGALGRARAPVRGMPASHGFNGPDQEWHYALSWMAVDYVCAAYGESRMWQLMAALHAGGGTADAGQDRVLEQVLGYDGRELARRAAARIRAIYG